MIYPSRKRALCDVENLPVFDTETLQNLSNVIFNDIINCVDRSCNICELCFISNYEKIEADEIINNHIDCNSNKRIKLDQTNNNDRIDEIINEICKESVENPDKLDDMIDDILDDILNDLELQEEEEESVTYTEQLDDLIFIDEDDEEKLMMQCMDELIQHTTTEIIITIEENNFYALKLFDEIKNLYNKNFI